MDKPPGLDSDELWSDVLTLEISMEYNAAGIYLIYIHISLYNNKTALLSAFGALESELSIHERGVWERCSG